MPARLRNGRSGGIRTVSTSREGGVAHRAAISNSASTSPLMWWATSTDGPATGRSLRPSTSIRQKQELHQQPGQSPHGTVRRPTHGRRCHGETGNAVGDRRPPLPGDGRSVDGSRRRFVEYRRCLKPAPISTRSPTVPPTPPAARTAWRRGAMTGSTSGSASPADTWAVATALRAAMPRPTTTATDTL